MLKEHPYLQLRVSFDGSVVKSTKTEHVLQQRIKHGYFVVTTDVSNKRKTISVHRLVFQTWSGMSVIPPGYEIDHVDNNKRNNNFTNLQLLHCRDHTHKTKQQARTNPQVKRVKIEHNSSVSPEDLDTEIWARATRQLWVSSVGRIKNSANGTPFWGYLHEHSEYLLVNHARIHMLVAKHFVTKPANFQENWVVNHINHNKLDNRSTNLEYISAKENTRLAVGCQWVLSNYFSDQTLKFESREEFRAFIRANRWTPFQRSLWTLHKIPHSRSRLHSHSHSYLHSHSHSRPTIVDTGVAVSVAVTEKE